MVCQKIILNHHHKNDHVKIFVDCFQWTQFDILKIQKVVPIGAMVFKDGTHYRYNSVGLVPEYMSIETLIAAPSATPLDIDDFIPDGPSRETPNWYWSVPPPEMPSKVKGENSSSSSSCIICGELTNRLRVMRSVVCSNDFARIHTHTDVPCYHVCANSSTNISHNNNNMTDDDDDDNDSDTDTNNPKKALPIIACDVLFNQLMRYSMHPRMFLFHIDDFSELHQHNDIWHTRNGAADPVLGRIDLAFGSVEETTGRVLLRVNGWWQSARDLFRLNPKLEYRLSLRLAHVYIYHQDSEMALQNLFIKKGDSNTCPL